MFDSIINNLPIELHLPSFPWKGEHVPGGSYNNANSYSYAGPGTHFIRRIREGYAGINELDKAAKEHDAAYHFYEDRASRTASDRILAEKALKIASDTTKSGYERAMAAFVYKTFAEGGLADKLQGKGMELRQRKPASYAETKPRVQTVTRKPKNKVRANKTISQMKFDVLAKELHKPARKNFRRRRVNIHDIDDTWGMDIVFMIDLAKENKEQKYILTIIDCLSKFAWAVPLKNKDASSVFNAFLSVINKSKRKPQHIWVDEGSEFYNALFTKWLKANNVVMYSTYENFHNPIIERFNRTLKTSMWRRFTRENTRNWMGMLDSLMHDYNNSRHRSIGMTPTQASDPENLAKVRQHLYPSVKTKLPKPKFALGDIVRISRLKDTFEKGFHPAWSEELLKVVKINNTDPRTYKIEALDGEAVTGSFYEQEMQKSQQQEDNLYRLEKVLRKKMKDGKEMALIKWAGYDKPTWEYAENILD